MASLIICCKLVAMTNKTDQNIQSQFNVSDVHLSTSSKGHACDWCISAHCLVFVICQKMKAERYKQLGMFC